MGFGLEKTKLLSEGISTNTLKSVFPKNIQLHLLVSRVWYHLLSVSWMMGAGTRLFYSKPCSFPSLLQLGTEHRCSFSIIIVPYCLANQRDANLFSPWLVLSQKIDFQPSVQQEAQKQSKWTRVLLPDVCQGFRQPPGQAHQADLETGLCFWRATGQQNPCFLTEEKALQVLSFPSQSSCLHREGWNAAGSPKRSGRRKIL